VGADWVQFNTYSCRHAASRTSVKVSESQHNLTPHTDRIVYPSQVPVEDSQELVEDTALLQRHHLTWLLYRRFRHFDNLP
jgi:hypothetical protein